jgi:glycerophosphoryl diester phosphodiesterase
VSLPPPASARVAAARPSPLRLAHRGDWRRAPENTLGALRAALKVPGCDGVEFDVRLARDGVPVVIHDATLERVQGVAASVDALAADSLGRYGIPTLAEVLGALPDAWLDVELKGDDHGEATAAALLAARGAEPGRAVVSSFEPPTLAAMRALLPDWPRWLNADDLDPATIARAVELGCVAVAAHHLAIDDAGMSRAQAAGLDVAAWTVRDRVEAARLVALGVVALCVEDAELDPG